MPLHIPRVIHRLSRSGQERPQIEEPSSADQSAFLPDTSPASPPPSFAPQSPASSSALSQTSALPPLTIPSSLSNADGRQSTQSSGNNLVHGILKNPTSPPQAASESTSPSFGASSGTFSSLHKRMSSMTFDRSETIDSFLLDNNGDNNESSTPATSVSSLQGYCPLPTGAGTQKFPFFMMTISSVSALSFVALPLALRTVVLDAVNRAWKKGISKIQEVDYQPELMRRHKEKGCEGGVWEITLRGEAWVPSSSEKVSSKRIILNLLAEFAREGYDLTSSFRTSAKDTGKDTLIFLRSSAPPDPDPVFFAVAFHSHDRIWIIDAEADVGQAVEEGIKSWWVDGVRDARVRERHCRELRLRGAPWTAHTTQSVISARCIHLTIMRIITNAAMGYDFVGSVDMADREEGEMPVTFYRRRWGTSTRAVWSMPPETTTD
ncbi:hypothetical protein C349_01762 [Cryptococcus neoformans var. grubii Br795]|nr:hypothetical protein C368_02500 [Cryptococcus neoformans var. grubii 125.91]OXG85044.1 hypothetical protein C350_01670 [Cryptococcus neoformans var. grubii MW-RSA36]OXG86843.1 hypothetical protein C349_01762 [Cryptococcus neoformans var. grubii Br795]OXL09919.1 hypothetical protein C348_01653 [Cryptococcus neoformans var. grubii Gb118]